MGKVRENGPIELRSEQPDSSTPEGKKEIIKQLFRKKIRLGLKPFGMKGPRLEKARAMLAEVKRKGMIIREGREQRLVEAVAYVVGRLGAAEFLLSRLQVSEDNNFVLALIKLDIDAALAGLRSKGLV